MKFKERISEISDVVDMLQGVIHNRLDLLKEMIPTGNWALDIYWTGVITTNTDVKEFQVELFHRWMQKKRFKTVRYEDSFLYHTVKPDIVRYEFREYGHGRTDPLGGGGYKVLKGEEIRIKKDKK